MMNPYSSRSRWLAFAVAVFLVAAAGYFTRSQWSAWLTLAARTLASSKDETAAAVGASDPHDHEQDHAHADVKPILTLSDQARQNLGLQTGEIQLTDYWKTLQIPGIVSEQQGHSERRIPATVAGIVTRLYVYPGQSVRPDDPLMDIQLTGELLTTAQSALLRTLSELELVDLEIKRLAPLVESGSIPAKQRIEKEYERRRLESQQLVQAQELLVRGLSQEQIDSIVSSKILIRQFTVRVPRTAERYTAADGQSEQSDRPVNDAASTPTTVNERIYSIEMIGAYPGKLVQPGDALIELALHTVLDVAGQAFERESQFVLRALQENWSIEATFETADGTPLVRRDLRIRYLESSVDGLSRIQKFHIPLVNTVLRTTTGDDGIQYHAWLFRPGQRVRLSVPIEKLTGRIILPTDAVVQEGADAYVFRQNGKRLERIAVIIEHMDARNAVLRSDGSLTPGFDVVARNHAYELNLELKKKLGESSGGGHSHEGHSHEGHNH